ncbi:MAG: GAF domain-containing protein [Nitrospirae bacterium]|nr:GAF domain-containing protein [Nitrospirota bacterium]
MPAGVLKSETVRFGTIGALLGASAPVLHTLLQMVVFHSDMSVSNYLHYAILDSHEGLASNIFIGGAAFVMAGAGAVVGRMRENDKRQQARIESSNRELAALNSISEIISRTRELDTILYLVLKETLSLSFLCIERKGAIFLRDESDPETLVMSASVDLAQYLTHHEKKIPVGYCLCGKAVRTGEVILSSDCFEDPDHATSYPGMTSHGHIVIPITGSGGVTGVMTYYTPARTVPSRDDIRILTAIASQLAVAIDNVRLQKTVSEAKADAHRKDTEIFKNVEALKGLIEVDRIILSTMDRDEMLFRVASQIRQIVPADAGGVAIKEEETGYYRYVG